MGRSWGSRCHGRGVGGNLWSRRGFRVMLHTWGVLVRAGHVGPGSSARPFSLFRAAVPRRQGQDWRGGGTGEAWRLSPPATPSGSVPARPLLTPATEKPLEGGPLCWRFTSLLHVQSRRFGVGFPPLSSHPTERRALSCPSFLAEAPGGSSLERSPSPPSLLAPPPSFPGSHLRTLFRSFRYHQAKVSPAGCVFRGNVSEEVGAQVEELDPSHVTCLPTGE